MRNRYHPSHYHTAHLEAQVITEEAMSGPAVITNVWREWKDQPACRSTAIDHGHLIVSHLGIGKPLKTCIRDAVRNKFALMPCLKAMAETNDFTLFGIQEAQRESLICSVIIQFLLFHSLVTKLGFI